MLYFDDIEFNCFEHAKRNSTMCNGKLQKFFIKDCNLSVSASNKLPLFIIARSIKRDDIWTFLFIHWFSELLIPFLRLSFSFETSRPTIGLHHPCHVHNIVQQSMVTAWGTVSLGPALKVAIKSACPWRGCPDLSFLISNRPPSPALSDSFLSVSILLICLLVLGGTIGLQSWARS